MKIHVYLIMPLMASLCLAQGQSPASADYLGQSPPGLVKRVFAPGLVSTAAPEGCLVFSHDGRFVVFRRHWREQTEIRLIERRDGTWTDPEVAPFFVSRYRFGDFTFAPDRPRLYFTSDRPLPGSDERNGSSDLWMVEHGDGEWREPVHLKGPVNSSLHESYPSVAEDGTLFFFRRYPKNRGLSQILSAELVDDTYAEPRILGDAINTAYDEWDPAISPDGLLLLFCSKKPAGLGADDLYVSFRDDRGQWSEAINLGEDVNTPGSENRPFMSADGRYLFFNSDAGGNRDVYWIDMAVVRRLAPPAEPRIISIMDRTSD